MEIQETDFEGRRWVFLAQDTIKQVEPEKNGDMRGKYCVTGTRS
jgi:hypothetical protein